MDRRDFLRNATMLAGVVAPQRLLKPLRSRPNRPTQPADATDAAVEGGSLLDLSNGVVVAPRTLSKREQKAVQMLVEEVEQRTRIRWPVMEAWQSNASATIAVGTADALRESRASLPDDALDRPEGREGFALRAWRGPAPSVAVIGADERGVLYGVGGLLRNLSMQQNKILVRDDLGVTSHPRYSLRGHQLGYRPKTNSYDGWTAAMWEQYIRDLAVFGANAVELIPPHSDDKPNSPHFWLSPEEMMVRMSGICDEYGLDVWIWYPAMAKDYSDEDTVNAEIARWGTIFKALPRIDAIFIPGGDPGHTDPKVLLAYLEKQRQNLRQYHPAAAAWISPQSFDQKWMDEFFSILDHSRPGWLGGVVFGPQIRMDIAEFRRRVPEEYPIRFYPDVTHSLSCEFPVPRWDVAYAHTEGREIINPRPNDYAGIMRRFLPYTTGFIAYSEGCNDDVNKCMTSSLAWNPEADAAVILREYSRYFIGDRLGDAFAQGLFALEENWRAPLIANEGVATALRQFQVIESEASPHELLNWRLQQGIFRAYYDAYVRSRLIYETDLLEQATARLEEIRRPGVRPVPAGIGDIRGVTTNGLDIPALLDAASSILEKASVAPAAQDLRTRILELGEALYQSIRMQMAVELYRAEAVNRGGVLDTLDAPITDVPWLLARVREIHALPDNAKRLAAILEILDRTNPGPGGFYDNLGDVSNETHLVRGVGATGDPEFRHTALDEFSYPDRMGGSVPMAWKCWAASLYDAPLDMHYPHLSPSSAYRIRVVYAGAMERKIRLEANKGIEIHGYIQKPWPVRPLEFDIPSQATAAGELRLRWFGEPGLGHNGQGCQVAEVWLVKKT